MIPIWWNTFQLVRDMLEHVLMLMIVVMPYVVIVTLKYCLKIPTILMKEGEKEEPVIEFIRGLCIYMIKTNLTIGKKITYKLIISTFQE